MRRFQDISTVHSMVLHPEEDRRTSAGVVQLDTTLSKERQLKIDEEAPQAEFNTIRQP